MTLKIKALLLLAIVAIASLGHVASFKYLNQPSYIRPRLLRMSDSTDFSDFAVGQEYQGKLIKAMPFGIFVDISKGTNVLLPRSVLSKGTYEKLKSKAEANADDLVKLELVSVSAENKTISGKYIPENYVARADISSLEGKDFNSKSFNATVVSTHEFGIFAELDEYGVEGLIPASKLGSVAGNYAEAFPAGSSIEVLVIEMNTEKKKLVLSLKNSQPDKSSMADVDQSAWMQAIVQSVTGFGLFVRPAGYETIGLVHRSQVPRELVSALKQQATIPLGTNTTDVEALFSEGDVIRVRVKAASNDKGKLELSMLPYKADAGDEDDYVVEGRDPEGEDVKQDFTEDDADNYDAQETLLWWKGQPYVKIETADAPVDEEVAIVDESIKLVEGSWRRVFELDLRADQLDFSSKIQEKEAAELAEEIGELDGLDDTLEDLSVGSGSNFGSYVSTSVVPAEWKEQMEFFRELENAQEAKNTFLRGGKQAEQVEFESLLKEVEAELSAATARMPRVETPVSAPVDEVLVEQARPAPVAAVGEVVPVEEAAPVEE